MGFAEEHKKSHLIGASAISSLRFRIILVVLLIVGAPHVFAHKNHHHSSTEGPFDQAVYQVINEAYIKDVKPIFQKKCFDCHSSTAQNPWYHSLPGIRQMMDGDIKEAKDHLDFSSDFPFVSHATPAEDLEAIQEEVAEDEMPPLRYRLMHPSSKLTSEEKEIVNHWVQFGKNKLVKDQNSTQTK